MNSKGDGRRQSGRRRETGEPSGLVAAAFGRDGSGGSGALTLVGAVLAVSLVFAATAPPVAAGESPTPSVVVALEEDGSADVEVTATFDLGSDEERAAFESLRTDSDVRSQTLATFRDRLQSVAAAAENETGRSMGVSNATMRVTTAGDETGVLVLSVEWTGLAAVEGDRLVVTEPFESGFTTDRTLRLVAPEGYAVRASSPTPAESDERTVSWDPGAELDGFEVTVAPASSGDDVNSAATEASRDGDGGTATSMPGFGIVASVVALAAVLAATRRE